MKKNLLLIFFLFFTLKLSACRCGSENIAQEYLDADFVGVITITKTFDESTLKDDNGFDYEFYKAEVHLDKVFKGQKFNALNAFGVLEDKFGMHSMDCSISLKPGQKYLAIIKKDKKNEYWVDNCSRMVLLNYHHSLDEENETIKHYTNLFENIEKYKNQFSDLKFNKFYDASEKRLTYPYTPHTDFIKLNISNPYERIGIYKVILNKKLKIKKIVSIKKVGEKDKKVEKLILKNLLLDQYETQKNKSSKSLLLLYFDDFAHLDY